MDELIKSMQISLANTFVLYFKSHSFHWNIEGINFPTYHGFFGDFYDEVFDAVDPMAEEIRALGAYAPRGLNELYSHATIADSDIVGDNVRDMLSVLLMDNSRVLECLSTSFTLANQQNKQGLANFLADRIDAHKKHEWMLRSCLKGAY